MVFLRRNDEFSRDLLTHLRRVLPGGANAAYPRVVIVSPDVTDRDTELPVLVDPDSTVARQFGAVSTPAAVLVDDRGARASQLLVGALRIRTFASELQGGARA
jgi:hypothetical protein